MRNGWDAFQKWRVGTRKDKGRLSTALTQLGESWKPTGSSAERALADAPSHTLTREKVSVGVFRRNNVATVAVIAPASVRFLADLPPTCGPPTDGGWGIQFVHGRGRMTINPRIPTMPGRNTSGFTNQADIACTKREAP